VKLIEALEILKGTKGRNGGALRCILATGLNPLHLKTFLAAELSLLFADRTIEISDGLYGDLLGNLDRLTKAEAEIGFVLVEWPDFDPRLGIRSTARWTTSELADIVSTARVQASHIQRAIEETCQRLSLVVCFPTLPLPPISFVPGWQAGSFELDLRAIAQTITSKVSQYYQVRVLSPQRIDLLSPLRERLDIKSEIDTGFPFQLPHASALANCLARLAQWSVPKKGLITDLEDTLWRGIVGEVGIDRISWNLDHHSQMHALYQRFLGALASEGVLIGVASKNDPSLVEEALHRKDLSLSPSAIFPVEASWGPKSQSVTRILRTWNVGPDSVVFVDDSPLELAEVKASHPEVECLQFPTKDSAAVYDLLLRLRDMFGKSAILAEDSIRMESIRRSPKKAEGRDLAAVAQRGFFESVGAEMNFNFSKAPLDPRALALVNKSNQFNLNGKRYTDASWQNYLLDPASLLLLVSYRDKFGPLGKVAVLTGYRKGKKMIVNTWVLSCRAFSRQLEYKCLTELFTKFDIDEIEFEYLRTDRNGPLRDFLCAIMGVDPTPRCTISREVLEMRLETLLKTQEVTNG
jgi:FkbH-like protein